MIFFYWRVEFKIKKLKKNKKIKTKLKIITQYKFGLKGKIKNQ